MRFAEGIALISDNKEDLDEPVKTTDETSFNKESDVKINARKRKQNENTDNNTRKSKK